MEKPVKKLKPDPKVHRVILENIKKIRLSKGLNSQQLAYKIGMSPAEYSKLENGHKPYIEKWLSAIAAVLGTDKFKLMIEEAEEPMRNKFINPEATAWLEKQQENLLLLFKALEEKDKAKDDMILILKEEKIYWSNKYYRLKAKLEACEKSKNPVITEREREREREREKKIINQVVFFNSHSTAYSSSS